MQQQQSSACLLVKLHASLTCTYGQSARGGANEPNNVVVCALHLTAMCRRAQRSTEHVPWTRLPVSLLLSAQDDDDDDAVLLSNQFPLFRERRRCACFAKLDSTAARRFRPSRNHVSAGATGRLRRYIVIQRTVDRRRGLAVERAPTTTYDNQLTKKSIRRESVGRAGDRPNDSLVVETATDDGRATVHRWTTPDDWIH